MTYPTPRDTRLDEMPEKGQRILIWHAGDWYPYVFKDQWCMPAYRWLPAPPPPTE
jgi:hypothetical protein